MIAAYVRVSSKSQKVATQKDAICRACKARSVAIEAWYSEQVSSRNERPELRRLREDARAGRVRKLYVYRLDRLSRGTICEMLNLVNEFEAHGCQVESIADGFSLEGPFREPMLAMLAMCAGMERNAIADRVASARARVEASGGAWGRPPRLTVEDCQRIGWMRQKKYSWRKIAKLLKMPLSTVYAGATLRRIHAPAFEAAESQPKPAPRKVKGRRA